MNATKKYASNLHTNTHTQTHKVYNIQYIHKYKQISLVNLQNTQSYRKGKIPLCSWHIKG